MNAPEYQLVVKEHAIARACINFRGADVDNVDGCRVLGSVVGKEYLSEFFLVTTIEKFSKLLQKLKKFGKTEFKTRTQVLREVFSNNMVSLLEQLIRLINLTAEHFSKNLVASVFLNRPWPTALVVFASNMEV